MNTNAIHNILNIAIAVISMLAVFDWTVVVSQTTAVAIVGALGTLKVIINTLRDGLAGLWKPQPPVVQ